MKFEPDVQMWDIEKIHPYSKNAKTHPEAQVAKLAAAMVEFGVDVPVVVDGNGVLIKGHGRRLAAKKLGLKQLPVIVRTDLSPTQVKAARIADNRISQSDWDDDVLTAEMTDLFEEDFQLDLTGFNPDEIAFMFGIDLEPEDEAAAADSAIKYKLILEFETQDEQQTVLKEMQDRGVKCKASA